MKRPSRVQGDSDAPEPPRSESEQRLSAWFRSNNSQGALAQDRASADTAFAMGHTRGLEEAKDDHFDSLRTLLTRILEASGKVEESTLDQIERASIQELEDWIVRAATAK